MYQDLTRIKSVTVMAALSTTRLLFQVPLVNFLFIIHTLFINISTAALAGGATKTDILCSYSELRGTIDISVSGGTAPYRYSVCILFFFPLYLQIIYYYCRLMVEIPMAPLPTFLIWRQLNMLFQYQMLILVCCLLEPQLFVLLVLHFYFTFFFVFSNIDILVAIVPSVARNEEETCFDTMTGSVTLAASGGVSPYSFSVLQLYLFHFLLC